MKLFDYYIFYVYFIDTLEKKLSYKIKNNNEWKYINNLLMDNSGYNNNEIIVTEDDYYSNGEYKTKHDNNKIIINTEFNKMILSCDIINNVMCGNGILYHENCNIKYKGKFEDGVYNGKGIKYHKNGNIKYDGKLKNGQYNGYGIMYDCDSNIKYEGKFKNGQYNGCGNMYHLLP